MSCTSRLLIFALFFCPFNALAQKAALVRVVSASGALELSASGLAASSILRAAPGAASSFARGFTFDKASEKRLSSEFERIQLLQPFESAAWRGLLNMPEDELYLSWFESAVRAEQLLENGPLYLHQFPDLYRFHQQHRLASYAVRQRGLDASSGLDCGEYTALCRALTDGTSEHLSYALQKTPLLLADGTRVSLYDALQTPHRYLQLLEDVRGRNGISREDLPKIKVVSAEEFAKRFESWRQDYLPVAGAIALQARRGVPYMDFQAFPHQRLQKVVAEALRLNQLVSPSLQRYVSMPQYRDSFAPMAGQLLQYAGEIGK